tara:strand:+ start:541 stop:777 length:237 start_codon:yes stop_codon:yes gene_type:complete
MKKKFNKVIDFYNTTDQHQKAYFLMLCSEMINVPIYEGDKVVSYGLDYEAPVCPNGTMIQLNTEQFSSRQKEKELNTD